MVLKNHCIENMIYKKYGFLYKIREQNEKISQMIQWQN